MSTRFNSLPYVSVQMDKAADGSADGVTINRISLQAWYALSWLAETMLPSSCSHVKSLCTTFNGLSRRMRMETSPAQDQIHKGLRAETAISPEPAHPVLALAGQAAQIAASSATSAQSCDQVCFTASAHMLQAFGTKQPALVQHLM